MRILNKETGEEKTIESKGSREALTLMKFMAKARKYANLNWKILQIETDSMTAYGYIQENKPELPIDLIVDDSE